MDTITDIPYLLSFRAKSCVLVYVAYNMALEYALRVAGSLGLTVEFIIHKVATHHSSYQSCHFRVTGQVPSIGMLVW